MKEHPIQKKVLKWLKTHGCLAMRINSGVMQAEHRGKKRWISFCSEPGVSDIICLLPGGMFAALEVKVPGKLATPKQEMFLKRVSGRGGLALIITSIEDLERYVLPCLGRVNREHSQSGDGISSGVVHSSEKADGSRSRAT